MLAGVILLAGCSPDPGTVPTDGVATPGTTSTSSATPTPDRESSSPSADASRSPSATPTETLSPAPTETPTTPPAAPQPVPDAVWDAPFAPAAGADVVPSGATVKEIGVEAFLDYQDSGEGLRFTLLDAHFGDECPHPESEPSERGTYLFLEVDISLSGTVPPEAVWHVGPSVWRASTGRDEQLDPSPREFTYGSMYCATRDTGAAWDLAPGMSTQGVLALDVTGDERWVTFAPANGPLWIWEIPAGS